MRFMGVSRLPLQIHSFPFPFCSESPKSTPVGCLSQAPNANGVQLSLVNGKPSWKWKVGMKAGASSGCLFLSRVAALTVVMFSSVEVLHCPTLPRVAPALLQCHLIIVFLYLKPGGGCHPSHPGWTCSSPVLRGRAANPMVLACMTLSLGGIITLMCVCVYNL